VSFFICLERFVDPDLCWDRCWFGGLADEAFGMDAIGDIKNSLALFEDELGLVVVNHGWGEQAQPGIETDYNILFRWFVGLNLDDAV